MQRGLHLPAVLLACALAALAAATATWWGMGGRLQQAYAQVHTLQGEVTRKQQELLGYSSYTTYLTLGQQALTEHMKLLTATVVREEGVTQVLERSLLGFSSTGTVAIWYTVDYPFGYDLQPGSYEIRAGSQGIEIHLRKPQPVATPAVHDLRYKILSGGLFTDEKAAVLKLYEEAAQQARTKSATLAADPAVMALCEKKLVQFLDDFLRRQPGVSHVPPIRVVYRN